MMMLVCPYVLAAGASGAGLGFAALVPRLRRTHKDLAMSRWAAEHDVLTGLPNRASLRRRFDQETAAGQPVTMVLLDLDGFKRVNDTWGHQAGDALLVAMARRLSEACPPEGFAGRLAGDEFLVLLTERSAVDARTTVASILSHIGRPMEPVDGTRTGLQITLAASAGVAGRHSAGERSWSAQLHDADIALYQAKEQRSGVVVFNAGMRHPRSRERVETPSKVLRELPA